jgi:drug/metabolite transporter (DMT)-like permease
MSHLKGESLRIIAIIILGWSSYTFIDTAVKHLATHYNIWSIINIGSFGAMIILGNWIFWGYGIKGFLSKKMGLHLSRGVIGAGINMSVIHALALVPLADFYGITFAAPFLILVLAYFLLKEHVGWHRWLTVIIGFIGVFILAGPQFLEFNIGYIYTAMVMFGVSASAIILRKIGKGDPLPLYGFYPVFFVFIISSFMTPELLIVPALKDSWIFAIQILGLIGGQMCVSYATAHAKSSAAVAPFVYIQIV